MDSEWRVEVDNQPRVAAGRLPSLTISPEAVQGIDNRRPVTNTTTFPASAIAQLIATARDGQTEGGATGVFITDRVLLTAAHAVFVPGGGPIGGMIQSMLVVPGRDGSRTPFGAARTTSFYVPDLWIRHQLPDADYALVFVPSLPAVGRYRPVVAPDEELQDLPVRIAGYPVDKPVGTQWEDDRVIDGLSPGQVAYDVDTTEGQSGAPVVHMQNGEAFVVAIHRFGTARANFGTRITRAIFDDIRSRV
jgi:V8-like Glu-specific endopeptidase